MHVRALGDLFNVIEDPDDGFEIVCEIEPPTRPDLMNVRHQIGVMSKISGAFLIPDNHIGRATVSSVAVAHEVARAGALGANPTDAVNRMRARAIEVTPGLGLDSSLKVFFDVSAYARSEGHVAATVRYLVDLRDLPLIGWAPPAELRARHVEWIDPFRGGIDDAAASES